MKNHRFPLAWAHFAVTCALAGLLPGVVHAEDIDIYQGTTSGATPNLLVILDNGAASDASASYTCNVTKPGGGALAEDSKTAGTNFGFERCGLYSAVSAIGTDTSLNGKINLGLMYFPSGGANGGVFVQPPPSPAPGALITMDGTGANDGKGLSQMLNSISGLSLTKDKSNSNYLAQSMQEAWAFYQGKTGLSGITYPGLGSQSCAQKFVLYITFATTNQKPQDSGTKGGYALQSAEALPSLPAQVPLPNWKSPVSNLLAAGKYQSDYADEWSSFMHTGKSPNLTFTYPPITSYTIILSNGTNPDYEQLMVSMAQQGGGQYFVVDTTQPNAMSDLVTALKRIFAEVQAVNSVFAAPVLPVSANTQGTYLNQIYMGMFRPDGTDAPRWGGNLKQYQFGSDTTTGSTQLFLADASWGPYTTGKSANGALSSNTGFISPTAVSFWTAKDTSKLPDNANANGGFWLNSYQTLGASNGFDAPDGQFVEKGGVGQQVRLQYLQDTYPASSTGTANTARNVYTCTGSSCVSGALLNTMKFNSANTNLTAAALGNASALPAWVNNLINWVRGEDTNQVAGDTAAGPEANKPPTATPPISIRGSAHGDVLHSRPVVINYGGTIGTVVFYGANDGMFRAINGNQPPATNASPQPMGNCTVSGNCAISMKDANGNTTPVPPGGELWSFVAQEFYPCLQQLYTNNMAVTLGSTSANSKSCNTPQNPSGKPYFFDGAPGVYWNSSTGKAYLFLSARRGGRLLYALDVSDPTNPQYMWKISNATSGFSELGQTWSQPKVAMIKGYVQTNGAGKPVLDSNGNVIPKPVLIFGGGYDTNQDGDPPAGADSMGRAIYVVDAVNGTLLWSATGGGTATTCASNPCKLAGMTSSIPADITLVDRDFDGLIDRLYAADTGGNLWRVDLQPDGTGAISTWKAYQFAALGGSGTSKRKFFFPPDVVLSKNYDVVVSVTGDREHPLKSSTGANGVFNRFYMIKDTQVGSDGSSSWTAVHDDTAANADTAPPTSALFNATSVAYDGSANGFYITLAGAGEKGINSPTTFGGEVYFGTNRPAGANDTVSSTPGLTCPANLGVATGYTVNFLTGTRTAKVFNGGGLVPSPVTGLVTVKVNGKDTLVPFIIGGGGSGVDGSSGLGAERPKIPLSKTKRRTYWYPLQDR